MNVGKIEKPAFHNTSIGVSNAMCYLFSPHKIIGKKYGLTAQKYLSPLFFALFLAFVIAFKIPKTDRLVFSRICQGVEMAFNFSFCWDTASVWNMCIIAALCNIAYLNMYRYTYPQSTCEISVGVAQRPALSNKNICTCRMAKPSAYVMCCRFGSLARAHTHTHTLSLHFSPANVQVSPYSTATRQQRHQQRQRQPQFRFAISNIPIGGPTDHQSPSPRVALCTIFGISLG